MHDSTTRVVELPAEPSLSRQTDSLARAARHAESVDRTIRAHARATGQDPADYLVLTPGTPEYAEAERALTRARGL